MKHILWATVFVTLFLDNQIFAQAVDSSQVNTAPFVIPSFQHWYGSTGFYTMPDTIRIYKNYKQPNYELDQFINTFIDDLKTKYPYKKIELNQGNCPKGSIIFDAPLNDTITPEKYALEISDIIHIKGNTALASFWATRSLLQILELNGDTIEHKIPKGTAIDYPNYALRGFVLDVGRKFFTIDFLRKYVKFMSYYKMNDFQIHLNDNCFKYYFNNNWDSTYSAFRLENNTYPNLTATDGSYTKKEFIELQQLAQKYGVAIVPEIDVPAHSLAFTKVFPEIASTEYGKDHLDINKPKTLEIIDNVFKEYLSGNNPTFIGEEIHIGTDEYAKKEAESFRRFTNHYIQFVQQYGKKVRLWGALTHAIGITPVINKNVTMNIWYNGYAEPADMMKLGFKEISTPDGWLYIVPKAGYYFDYLDIENLYNNWTPNVIGDKTFTEKHPKLRGGSFAVWNDIVGNGISEKDVHDRVFPAMQVLSQKMWYGAKTLDAYNFNTFKLYATKIGEGPGLNIRGKITGKDSLILYYPLTTNAVIDDASGNKNNAILSTDVHYKTNKNRSAAYFKSKQSNIKSPIAGIGFGYTVSFWMNPTANNTNNSVLFTSPDATVFLKQKNTGKLGFSRDGYNFNFNYAVPENEWTHITITGTAEGTTLYVNGIIKDSLYKDSISFKNYGQKKSLSETLFFPLQYIGSTQNSFIGYLSQLKVFNTILPADKIYQLFLEH